MDKINSEPIIERRILVISQPSQETTRRLRLARFWAMRRGCSWEVLHSELPRAIFWQSEDEYTEQQLLQGTALQLGAFQVTLTQPLRLMADLAALLEERRRQGIVIDTILLIESEKRRWLRLLPFISLSRVLEQRFGSTYNIISINRLVGRVTRSTLQWGSDRDIRKVLAALGILSLAVPAVEVVNHILPPAFAQGVHNQPLIFLVACAFVTGYCGTILGIGAALLACVMQALLYYPPYFSLFGKSPPDIMAIAIFLAAAILLAVFNYNIKYDARRRAALYQSLLRVHKVAFDQHTRADTIRVLSKELAGSLRADVAFFMPQRFDPTQLELGRPDDKPLSDSERQALEVCWQETRPTGAGCADFPDCAWRFEPLLTPRALLGVFGFTPLRSGRVDDNLAQLSGNVADQAALILERLEVEQIAEEKRVQAERDQLRVMLLSSVSHDLKTPLASIIGSLSVIRSLGQRLSEEQRLVLIDNALDEAQRLDSFISNILDMTRLESDQVEFKKEWIDPVDLARDTARTLRDRLRRHKLTVKPLDQAVQVYIDGMMFGHVLQNLLDNAVKYTPSGTAIDVECRVGENGFQMDIRDHGRGIAPEYFEKIFDKYARIARQDTQVAGTGLGLALARIIMKNQGCSIGVANHPEGGAVFSLSIPEWREAVMAGEAEMADAEEAKNVA